MADKTMNVRLVSPEALVFEGDASSVVAPAWDGQVGILSDHAPMITLLGVGELAIDAVGGGSTTFYVAGGVLKVEDNGVTILTEFAGDGPPEAGLPDGIVVQREDLTDA